MARLLQPRLLSLGPLQKSGRNLRLYLAEKPRDTTKDNFDIFLSHSSLDRNAVFGIVAKLEQEGLSVYVDWIYDPDHGSEITDKNAEVIRKRMRQCNHMLYALSVAAKKSKWMPWELGYFDGRRVGYSTRIALLPISDSGQDLFKGQEYLGLYPYVALDSDGNLSAFGKTAYREYVSWIKDA